MKLTQLMRYDIPPEVIALWQRCESEELLPLQEAAVRRHNLFDGGNLLIQAPTSSGKTFIGEMAAIQTALRRKKVVYLVPLKALAEEKFADFREKYSDYGIKVIISTRDHRDFDRDLEDGDFSIAVVVYEKISQLLVRRPERLSEIDLIIADELELLSDPDRGAMAELLLTRILCAGTRLIGLSAVIGAAARLAAWMRAELVYYERRPVELRFGVLFEGAFRYRTYNEGGEGSESFGEAEGEDPWEVLTQTVRGLTNEGEACLVFVKAKHESRRGAESLAGALHLPAATRAIEALKELEATRSRDCLLDTLSHGVAFHNADMSPSERRIVEQAFREGEILLLVSTSTLAVGLNLPARNVFLSPDKWRYDQRLGMPWKTPVLRAEYENMSGRAGRYGAGHEFGRSILIAATPFDRDTYWRRYIEGDREPIEPRLAREPLENHVLRLVASRFCRTREELLDFLESTLTGRWVWLETYTRDEIAGRIRAAVNRCLDADVLACDGADRLEATPFGRAVAAKGIGIETALALRQWIGVSETRHWSEIDLILAVALTPEGRMAQVMLTAREYERADYPGRLKRLMRDEDNTIETPMNRLRNNETQPFFEEVRAIKTALFLAEWIEQAPIRSLEEHYNTMAGQILSAADQCSWLIDATAAIATALGSAPCFCDRILELAERVARGLQAEALPLARLNLPGLDRPTLSELVKDRLHLPGNLDAIHLKALALRMPEPVARALKLWARCHLDNRPVAPVEAPPPAKPVLMVDDRRPGEILVDGVRIALQDKQYRMIRTLAVQPGVCVPYEDIYTAVWGEVIVENNQMHFQKRKLLAAICAKRPERADLIATVPKRGFVLQLPPELVSLQSMPVSTAA